MKLIKKVITVCSFCILLTVSNCYAVTLDNINITKDELNCIKTYLVQDSEKESFINNLEKEIEVYGKKYNFDSYSFEEGKSVDTIDIKTTKQIISKTNNLDKIMEQLGNSIKYEKNGYDGEYLLNPESIKITTNHNGFKEDLIEKTIEYTNLERNDLEFIPKKTTKDGLILDLLNVEWQVQTNKKVGNYEVPDLYTAKGYYATKKRINYPNTYTVNAQYNGTAKKEINKPNKYIVKYKKIEEKAPVVEKKDNKLVTILGTSTGILVLIVLLVITRNITVYNYKNGKYTKVGKTRLHRNNIINLSGYSLLEESNKYRIVFSTGLTNKKKGQMITICKGNKTIKMLVNNENEKFSIETRI